MKKLIFFSCCILFVTFLGAEKRMIKDHEFSIALTRNETDYVILVFDFGHFQAEPVTIAGKTYYSLNLEKESNIQERGYPELPTINRSLIIPDASGVAIEILDSESVDYSLPVAPSKGEILRSQDPATVPYSFAGIYQEDAFFPESTAKLGDPYILRDFRGILLTVFPFAYNPRSGTLRIYHHLEVKVTFQGRSETNIKDRPRNGYSADFECVYRNHFLNFDPSRYTQVDETGRLIVICHGDFLDEIQPYVDWKLQKGIQTDLYDVASIGATAELIKAFIEDEYDSAEGLTFVQLVGDAAQIPTFLSGIHGLDPVYAEVEGSDSYPDLFVGRFSGTETAHIATQVERTLYYERDIDPGNWMHYALGVASNQGPGDDGEFDWQHLDNIRDDLLAYNYTYVGQVYDPGATDTEVANELNAGRGFVNYTGHGSIYSWSTSGFNTTDINNLTNSFTLPFICDVACYNGDFVNYSCFGEIWLRATHNTFGFPTGAIAIYASSISQPWNPPMAAQDEVTDLLVAEEMNTVGGLFFNGSCQMMDDYPSSDYVFEAWNIFGDVSLMVRTDTPAELLVTHSSIIDGNDTVFFVSTGFSGALVCLTDADNQIIDSGYTNVLGWIYLDLPARSGYEEYNLTVTAYNYDTYQATITVYDGNAWLGEFNYYWHNDANWSYGHIPTVSEKVLITTQGYHPPKVDLFDETCADLDILPGATLQIWDQSLTVDGDLDIEGTLAMQDAASYLLVYGDVFWQPGSEATILADNTITVQGNWNFQNGCGVHLENGSVNMNGPLNSWIRFYDTDSYFNDLKISKNSGYYAKFSNLSTCNPQVQGNLLNYTGSVTGAPASFIRTIYLGGYFYNEDGASFQFDNGDFVFTGNNPYLGLYTDDDYFNNLTLSCTGTTYIWDDLHVKGNLTITSGQLDMVSDSSVIEVGGNWDNQVGPAAFLEGANKVRFNGGNYHQYCSNEDFYRLEVAKTSGGAFRINGTDVTCGHYLFSGGAVDVLSGSFTASDLDQNGIYGAFYLNPGGIINLSNYDGYVDINGQLHIFGGTMNVYGNMGGSSMWGYGNSASLEMSGGVLDFKEIGISQSSANEVVENISAGTIRTAGSFTANYWDFSPSGGMVELYGPNNSNVGLMTGNYFNKLTINKAATDIPLIAGSASDTLNNYSMNMWNNLPRREMVKETKIGQHNIKEIIETQPPVPGKDRDGNQVLITR
ncbi:MAG: hypothetical protein JXB60_07505, partial [Candidatus Cloacimonetes bacterium]|nr:hypothetical protein [Candidatus Cloacimonadota bacterium]